MKTTLIMNLIPTLLGGAKILNLKDSLTLYFQRRLLKRSAKKI